MTHTVEFIPHEETVPSDLLCLAEMGGVADRAHVVDWMNAVQEALEGGDWTDALDAGMRMVACLAALANPIPSEDPTTYFCTRKL